MTGLSLENIYKEFGDKTVLSDISLTIEGGEFAVIVGPSGCGKSTLLRTIAGLEEVSDGSIIIDGTDVTGLPPAERKIAMVFQSYALYPHMSVYDNMAFGMKVAKKSKTEIDRAVRSAAETLGLLELLDRKPKALSGGERQRTAIGRAIVRRPSLFLFDEPLSNLDAALRVHMRHEFSRLHTHLKTTMVYVTHDQVEAMTLADKIIVLRGGKVEQVGTPADLYNRPANQFVAGFIGSPPMNFLTGKVQGKYDKGATVVLKSGLQIDVSVTNSSVLKIGQSVSVGIRPEDCVLGGLENSIQATLELIEPLGGYSYMYAACPDAENSLIARTTNSFHQHKGDHIMIGLPAKACRLFDSTNQTIW